MRRKIVLASTIALLMLLAVSPVFATPNTKLEFIQDVAPGGTTADADMDPVPGTEGMNFGFVNFNQDEFGNLRVTVVLKNAEPNKEYTIYLVGGPTHDTVTGFFIIGTLTTNKVGNGAVSSIIVDVATLQGATGFGSGARTDHMDVLGEGYPATAGGYVVTGVNYVVP